MNIIEAKYLTKVYKNGDYGLRNCSLSVKRGEFLVVVGASGEGKSTLLKVLAGTEKLSSGELYIDGILAESIPSSKRDVSMVFQEYLLYPHMTVFDNLATPLKLKGEDEKSIYDRVMEALRLFGLEKLADVKPKNLSGGEQQRCALAKALLRRSRLILLDEPMSNVDEKSRLEYCKTLEKMKQMLPESTFVYVTHNPREALFLADRIAVMRRGAVIQIAPRDFLIKHFDDHSVMELLGLSGKRIDGVYDGIKLDFDQDVLLSDNDIEYSRLIPGQKAFAVENALDDSFHLFDESGKSINLSSTDVRLSGSLCGEELTFGNQSIRLSNEYMSRLLRLPDAPTVSLSVEKFSKTLLSDSFSLVFTVVKNCGNYTVLALDKTRFILNRKTNLEEDERIRLYYRLDDVVLYDGEDRITCHYPLHRAIDIKVINPDKGVIEILGKRLIMKNKLPRGVNQVRITDSAFRLSYEKGGCAVAISDCLDEEFINGKKICQIAIRGVGSYLSFAAEESISCFGKNKVWLNIIKDKIEFITGE